MSFSNWFTVAALALLPLAATAQQKPSSDPTDANAPVPASIYQSAFQGYQTVSDAEESPANAWRAANQEVEKLGGHAGHMKDPAAPSSAPAQAVPMDHSKHH